MIHFEVDDRVRWTQFRQDIGTVLALHGHMAWVLMDETPTCKQSYRQIRLDELEPVTEPRSQ